MADSPGAGLRLASPRGRWVLAAAVLGSGAVFLEASVVVVAVPAIGDAFGLGMEGLQWVLNAYLLTLTALLLLGGSLGDVYRRRRVLVIGTLAFGATSVLCGLAPDLGFLIGARLLQGAAGALLVPNSLAVVESSFVPEDRAAAIGHWAAWSAISTALGPLAGGWLVDALSWRWVFACVLPFAILAAAIAWRHVPDSGPAAGARRRVDYGGATLVTVGLSAAFAALMAAPGAGSSRLSTWLLGAVAALALGAFVWHERRSIEPLLPLSLFRSVQFSGANVMTLLVYTALGGLFFLLVLQLENVLGFSAAEAGIALLPINVLMLVLSPLAGKLAGRVGPQWPMAVGALACAIGLVLLAGIGTGGASLSEVLTRVAAFGFGLALLVAPLTSAVLDAVPDTESGVGAAVNNAVARLAGLLGTAVLPVAAGLGGLHDVRGADLAAGYVRAMWIAAALCVAGAVAAIVSVRGGAAIVGRIPPAPGHGCVGPCERASRVAATAG